MPDLSNGLREDDLLTVPNIPFISAIPNVKQLGFFENMGFKAIVATSKPKEFHNLTAAEHFSGYSDSFTNWIETVKWNFKSEDVGILAPRRGVTKKSITVFAGTGNVYDVGKVVAMDSQEKLNIWKSERCNQVSGSDGVIYGPNLVQERKNLDVYVPNICRSLPLIFEKEVRILNGFRSYYYKAAFGAFSSLETFPENEFYCELKSIKEKHVDGVLDISGCIDGNPPAFVSHPHFMEGEAELFKHFDGLKPDPSLHSSFVYLHPRLAVPLYGVSRMQFNLKVNHFGNHYKRFPDGILLPLAWIEMTNGEFPDHIKTRLFLSTVVVDLLETLFKYGSLISSIISIVYFIINFTPSFKSFPKLLRKLFLLNLFTKHSDETL